MAATAAHGAGLPGPLNIADGIRDFATATPDAIAIRDGDRCLSYAGLHERAGRVGAALLNAGLSPGDPVAVLLGNRLEYPEIAAGLGRAGLPMVPLNPRLTAPEVDYIVGHSRARAMILDDALAEKAQVATGLDHVLCIGGTSLGGNYEQVLAGQGAANPRVGVDEREPFCIAYTSGTTGRPKGVLISHRSRALTFLLSAMEWGLGLGRRTVAVAPLYHGAGFAFGYAPVCTGGTVSMLRAWDPEEFLALVARDRIQSVFLVPAHAAMLRALGDQALARHDLSSLDTLYFNAAPLPGPLKEWVMAAFPQCGVHEVYGSTEAGVVSNCRPADAARKLGSVGPPWFLTEVRLVDEAGQPVPRGERGELFSRSPYLMNGYLDDPQATAACSTEDGFLSSGDIAVQDDDGFLYIVDRTKDLIITGGLNVYPRDVEEAIVTHPAVAEAAVVGVPHEVWGEQVVAHVVLRPGTRLAADELEAHLRPRLAGYKLPRRLLLVEALPRNAAGKVLKRDLRNRGAS